MTSVPDPGPEPTLEEIVAEQERERLFDIIRELVKWENSNNERVLQAARAAILRSCNGKPPPVYDPFCGGGSIPLEAHASDLNPVPVLITKALIEIPPKFAGKPPVHPLTTDYADNTDAEKKSSVKSVSSVVNQTGSWKGAAGLAEDIRYYGQWMREVSDARFPTTIYYAFKQTEDEEESDDDADEATGARASTGWETFLQGLGDAGWQIDGTWPMRTELGNRMRNLAGNALASSIVLVCRPRPKDAGVASRRDFLAALKRELPEALRNLQKGNIAPVDLAQAAIGPGMAVFSRYARVMESDGSAMTVRAALAEINKCLDEVLAEQEGEFDADTRWALAWFDQHGFGEGPYRTAETLCTAKNTSVAGMAGAGILVAKSGKVRLLRKEELADDWDPATDDRLTVWEIAHYLSRSLEQSESGAAALLKKLGSKGEVARDLAYRLYAICERRKWAKEAMAYNALVLSWLDVSKLAQQPGGSPVQGKMI